MRLIKLLSQVLRLLLPLCVLSLAYLYTYPFFHGCAFPLPNDAHSQHSWSTWYIGPFGHQQQAAQAANRVPQLAPFRLLALGDPQLEGDSSLPNLNKAGAGLFPSLAFLRTHRAREWTVHDLIQAFEGLILRDVPMLIEYGHKWLDLLGNDFYLAHIFHTIHTWTRPTHVVVLGDLLGSQWVSDEEFTKRSDRFWKRVFSGGDQASAHLVDGVDWSRRILTVAGNHDIGYAGDIDEKRIERFEQRFSPVNWHLQFELTGDGLQLTNDSSASKPSLRLVMLNSMNLDTPAKSSDHQSRTYDFLNGAIANSQPLHKTPTYGNDTTVLLTHIPLHKTAGTCPDSPYFDFFPDSQGGGVKEQNHLSDHVSQHGILEGLFGMKGNQKHGNLGVGRNGIILTGHDHVGCDVWHWWNQSSSEKTIKDSHWVAASTGSAEAQERRNGHEAMMRMASVTQHTAGQPGIREITVRSMMGEFGGNAGLLSAWFDEDAKRWRFDYSSCSLGVQHIWWAVHAFALVTSGVALSTLAVLAAEQGRSPQAVDAVRTLKSEILKQEGDTPKVGKEMTPELPETPRREMAKLSTPSLNRSESKRLASEVMKQRRERYQRSLRGRKDAESPQNQSASASSASLKSHADKDWEVVDSDVA